MKLSEKRQLWLDATGTVSSLTRNICYSLIAIIWILSETKICNLPNFYQVLLFVILSLSCDYLQYIWKSLTLGLHYYKNERKGEKKDIGMIPNYIDCGAWLFWGLKIVTCVVAVVLCALSLR